ncbi:MAG: 30S ribosomal protein S12 methylthiotransferase RimO [Gammaproteobacteria bacterium]|nr:MAG: 30S ribosomal protein S12 methylthiotransferase RimO [Gammaproteobacteria bacterium]
MAAPKVGFVSLGCPKALVDSERMLTRLREEGYEISPTYQGADLVVVNTCGFIDSAKQESIEAIGEALVENGRVIVTGCLGSQAESIRAIHPKVLDITGPQQYEAVVAAVRTHAPISIETGACHVPMPPQGVRLTPSHYAYLKIAEGCNNHCSFCIIPALRGRLASRTLAEILREAETLVASGVRELLVISQDTGAYGADRNFGERAARREDLHSLCVELGKLGVWVRLHYVYPYPHVDRIIPLMQDNKILPYLDVPFQHGSPAILKAMKRPAAVENNLKRIQSWREACPDLTLRSSFIVGFPGETDADFELLIEFLREARLDRVGCFQYSAVSGAAANALPDAVPEAIKEERWERLMQTQADISAARQQERIGKVVEAIIDEAGEVYIGRSHADAPEIDGVIRIDSRRRLFPGDILKVLIQAADDYDCSGINIEDID